VGSLREDSTRTTYRIRGPVQWNETTPVVVLTDGSSHSAADYFPAAMKELGRATIIGMNSAGNTEGITGFNLGDGTMIRLAVSTMALNDGTLLEDVGVTPDIEVPLGKWGLRQEPYLFDITRVNLMDSTTSTILVLVIIFFSTFVRSALGFGDALIAMPLLAFVVGMQVATPLVAMIGLYFLKEAPESLIKAILGILLVGFSLYNLISPKLPQLKTEKWSYVTGFLAGILGGAYNTNGPPVVVYGMLRKWSPEKFRATLQGYFLPTGAAILIGHGLAGMWTPEVVRLYAYCLPVIVGAVLLGGWVNQKIPKGKFDKIIYGFLVIVGVLLIVK